MELADKSHDAVDPGTAGGFGSSGMSNKRVLRLPFITANIDDADTFTFGSETIASRVAWEPVDATDLVAAVLDADGAGVTFASTGDNHNGYLIAWVNG
jgi:hypothetical protein